MLPAVEPLPKAAVTARGDWRQLHHQGQLTARSKYTVRCLSESPRIRVRQQRQGLAPLGCVNLMDWLDDELKARGLGSQGPGVERLRIHSKALSQLSDQLHFYAPFLQRITDEVDAAVCRISGWAEEINTLKRFNKKLQSDVRKLLQESHRELEHAHSYAQVLHKTVRERDHEMLLESMKKKERTEVDFMKTKSKNLEAKLKYEMKERSELEATSRKLKKQREELETSLEKEKALHMQADKFVASLQARYAKQSHTHEDTMQEHRKTLKMLEDAEAEKELFHQNMSTLKQQLDALNAEDADPDKPEDMASAASVTENMRQRQQKEPHKWTLTIGQMLDVMDCCMKHDRYTKTKLEKSSVNMYDINSSFVIPWTKGTGCSVAILMNQDKGMPAGLMLSHAWAEDAEEFKEAVENHVQEYAIEPSVAVWFCLFAIYQAGHIHTDAGPAGPPITQQLSLDPFEKVICSVGLKKGFGMNVVHTSQADLYARLWCVHELERAISLKDSGLEVTISMSHAYKQKTIERLNRFLDSVQKVLDATEEKHGYNRERRIRLWEQCLWVTNVKVKSVTATCNNPDDEIRLIGKIMQLPDDFGTIDTVIEQFRKERLLDDLEVMQRAVRFEGTTLQHAGPALKLSRELVTLAVENNSEALRFAGEELRDDEDMVNLAVQKDGKAIQFASDRLKTDKDVILLAMQQDPAALEHAILNTDNIATIMQKNPLAIEFVPQEMYKDALAIAAEAAKTLTSGKAKEFQRVKDKAEAQHNETKLRQAADKFHAGNQASRAQGKRDLLKLTEEIAPNLAQQRLKKALNLMCVSLNAAVQSSTACLPAVQKIIQKEWSEATIEEQVDYADVFLDKKLQLPEELKQELFPKEIYGMRDAPANRIMSRMDQWRQSARKTRSNDCLHADI